MITKVFISDDLESLIIECDDGDSGVYELPAGSMDFVEIDMAPADGYRPMAPPCTCEPDMCKSEAEVPCLHCETIDGELSCPAADVD